MRNFRIKQLFIAYSIIVLLLLVSCAKQQPKPSPQPQQSAQPKAIVAPKAISTPVPSPTPQPSPSPTVSASQPPLAFFPSRIEIPAVALAAPVVHVGILDNGQMEVPKSSDIVGVLAPGIMPGEQGTAIMAGHVDSYTGPAIFYPLKKLKPGDQIFVLNETGQKLGFQVTAVESYVTEEAPLDLIYGDTEESRLNLITCTGKFNRKLGTHEKRLVVYTKLME